MADPEIELPLTQSQLDVRSPGINQIKPEHTDPHDPASFNYAADLEKLDERNGEASADDDREEDSKGEIVYHYLTFATTLPSPTTIHPSFPGGEVPPQPPNLLKYTSPFEWSTQRKDVIIWISCIITALTAFTAGSYSPGVGQMTAEWHVSSTAALVGITTFTAGM